MTEFSYWNHLINPSPNAIVEVSEYDGSPDLALVCTQLAYTHTPSQQKRILNEWCDFFSRPQPIERLWLHSRTPQNLFQSICTQTNLKSFYIKWAAIDDLSPIVGLQSIIHLHITGSVKVKSIDALAKLQTLLDLSLEKFLGISNYQALGELAKLTRLDIHGDGIASMKKIKIDSLEFISSLHELERLSITWAIVQDNSFSSLTAVKQLQHLDLPNLKDKAQQQQLLATLPLIKTGNLLDLSLTKREFK